MATVREYYETDNIHMRQSFTSRYHSGDDVYNLVTEIVIDFEANAKYWYCFIPTMQSQKAFDCVLGLLSLTAIYQCDIGGVHAVALDERSLEHQDSNSCVFTRRIIVYADADLTADARQELMKIASQRGLHLIVRDKECARKRSEREKPLAFISHDSRDKEVLVRELALEMTKLMCPVWYDEYSLKVGDSLRESIEKGLKNARKCILVLSPNFLSNGGWPKTEYTSVFTRELLENNKIIIPVWHNVTKLDVYNYSPMLSDKWALLSSLGPQELAKQLVAAVRYD